MVTFGDGDVEPSHGSQGGGDGTLNIIQLRYPGETEWRTLRTKDLVEHVPGRHRLLQVSGGGGGWGDPRERAGREGAATTCGTVWSFCERPGRLRGGYRSRRNESGRRP